MMNPIMWAVNRLPFVGKLKDLIWRYEFACSPVKKLGNIYVKDFRGSLYMVEVEDITPVGVNNDD